MMISEPSFIPYSSYTPDVRGVHPLSSSPASSAFFNTPSFNSPPLNGMLTEEVTTIFVVGFPEDMQEREFQNMFMFSPGFEAASLKWHCKDQDDDSATSSLNTPLNGKKQMIGFARFRSRLEALEAVDVISGKKVDQDKGLILKAEMAKKNLHIKRGSIVPGTTDTTPSSSSSPLESLPSSTTMNFGNNNNNNNNINIINNHSKNLMLGHHEPFSFSPLPSDLLSPVVDYKSDPFALAAEHQPSQTMTPSTPVFNDNLFGFRTYSIDGRINNTLGTAPRTSISSNTSFTHRLSIKQPQHPIPEDISLDPFNYLSKSSPVPVDRIGSYFSEDTSFGSNNNGFRTDFSTITTPAQRSNSLMMTSPPQRPTPMSINNSSNGSSTTATTTTTTTSTSTQSTNNNNNNSNFLNNMMMMATPNLADQNPPCNTLYVGNLPPNTNEDELRQLFSKCAGYKRMYFRTKPQGPMCFVEFDDVMCATQIMTELQGHTLSNSIKGGIRLSFSKNPLFTKPNKNDQPQRTMMSSTRDFVFDPQL
ncbi:uncharacterized protein BX664DRAFT_358026 [Halteromyces radiatus]|uniref:uncharacterized protein n=1 Tax=Halteromyces radiatus TaxID=101107 RepID=UPI002220E0DD|nr:uncharacterized protein BX664DRAFT_358026 [Halteromyces radiatus]KAI8093594.1 hypothetical protein BX664DRAFT_358026 [Halteromyces radiatus]